MTKRVLLLAALGLLGCPPTDDGKNPTGDTGDTMGDDDDDVVGTGDTAVPDPDDDADGFPASVDCNDADPLINPDAVELCDGVDNNCNKAIDDEAAATLDGANYATLDDAVAAAAAGSLIDVCPGDHDVTSLALGAGDDLTFFGVAGSAATSISDVQGGSVAVLSDDAVLTLQGVTVTGATYVPGIEINGTASLSLIDGEISGNMGNGIYINGAGATILIEGSTISGNDAGAENGGGIYGFNGFDLTITDSTISGNNAMIGGGIYAGAVFVPATVTLTGATIDGNSADAGGGLCAYNVTVTGDGASFVQNNTAVQAGGGLALYRSPVSDLLVSGNSSVQGGGVVALFDNALQGSPLQNDLSGVIIDSNTADSGGGIYIVGREEVNVDGYSAVTLNTATAAGGGAYVEALGSLASDGADWGGAVGTGTGKYPGENTPDDVYASGPYSGYGAGAVFSCDGSVGCN